MRPRSNDVCRRYARELRQAAALGGLVMLSAGLIVFLEALDRGTAVAFSAAVLLAGGAAVAFRGSRAPRPIRSGGLKADLFVFGVALAVGGAIARRLSAGSVCSGSLHRFCQRSRSATGRPPSSGRVTKRRLTAVPLVPLPETLQPRAVSASARPHLERDRHRRCADDAPLGRIRRDPKVHTPWLEA
jgi:hypothetical protein